APAVLLPSEALGSLPGVVVLLWIEDTGGGLQLPPADANPHARVALDVANPMRLVEVLGQDVELVVRGHEPDLYLARQSRYAAGRGQIEDLQVTIGRGLHDQDQQLFLELRRAAYQRRNHHSRLSGAVPQAQHRGSEPAPE